MQEIIATIPAILSILQHSNATVLHTITVIVAMWLIYSAGRKS